MSIQCLSLGNLDKFGDRKALVATFVANLFLNVGERLVQSQEPYKKGVN